MRVHDPAAPTTPRPPALSFTMAGYRVGDLDRNCATGIRGALANGFTSMTLVPAFAFDPETGRLSDGFPSQNPGEIASCLEKAWQAGLDVVYQPHIESVASIQNGSQVEWRAELDVNPMDGYAEAAFGELLRWLPAHAAEIAEGTGQLDIIAAAELELSTAKRPVEWTAFLAGLRGELRALGVESEVRLGFDPNWLPDAQPADCAAFRTEIKSFDFMAMSFYGDMSQTGLGNHQIRRKKDEYLQKLMKRDPHCEVPEMKRLPFSIGEFGVGGDLKQTFRTVFFVDMNPVARERVLAERRKIYRNLLGWAKRDVPATARPLSLNVWTAGDFDPVGVLPDAYDLQADPVISALFRKYSRERGCPN